MNKEFTGIKAYVRMEERYEGLNILFETNNKMKEAIINIVEEVKKETGLAPFIFEKISNDRKDIQAIYIEFHDDVHRTGGDFFERVLRKLDIDKCEDEACGV
jgi:hypothetical protein